MIGGMISSTLLTLIVIPASFRLPREDRFGSQPPLPAEKPFKGPQRVPEPAE
jgi:hypothetical protein